MEVEPASVTKRAKRGAVDLEMRRVRRRQAEIRSKDGGAQKRKHGRSRISNDRDVLPDVDGRSTIARRYKDISKAIYADQGGADRCSESRKQLIRRFSAAAVLAEQMESRLANGEQIDIQRHATLSSTLVRLAQRIGIDRVPRDVDTLTLSDYLRQGVSVAVDALEVDEPVVLGPAAETLTSGHGNGAAPHADDEAADD